MIRYELYTIFYLVHFEQDTCNTSSNEESGGGGKRSIRARGSWGDESRGEGNKGTVIRGMGP